MDIGECLQRNLKPPKKTFRPIVYFKEFDTINFIVTQDNFCISHWGPKNSQLKCKKMTPPYP